MTILDRLYASSGPEAIIDTLQVDLGDQTFWLAKSYFDVTATLENGSIQVFIASDIDVALAERSADGSQDLTCAISNIDGKASAAIRYALENNKAGEIIHRKYLSTDFSAPQEPPISLTLKQGTYTATEVQFTAGYMTILDWSWPRKRYTLSEYPGLRYLS